MSGDYIVGVPGIGIVLRTPNEELAGAEACRQVRIHQIDVGVYDLSTNKHVQTYCVEAEEP